MRIDKFLVENNICSRSEAKEYIKKGFVKVNGIIVKDNGFHIDESKDSVSFKDKLIEYSKFSYFMLNKPSGYVSATFDNNDPTVLDLLKNEAAKGLFPVGRLDKDTTGLLIITNDGELGHFLTSPRKNIEKEYLVSIEHSLSEDDIMNIESGVSEGGDDFKPAKVKIIDENNILITVTEGKYHEVKRILKAVNNCVLSLKRVSENGIILDESLKEGEYRKLSQNELEILSAKEKKQ